MGGGIIFVFKSMETLGRRRGEIYMKFPPWWGYGYFLELTMYI